MAGVRRDSAAGTGGEAGVRARIDRSLHGLAAAAAAVAMVAAVAGAASQSLVLAVVVGTLLVGAVVAAIQWERQRLHRTVSQPIESLVGGAVALGRGEALAVAYDESAPVEVHEALAGLQAVQDRVAALGSLLHRRDQAVQDLEGDLQLLLSLARDVSGSVNVGFVVRAAASAAATATGAERVVVWLKEGPVLRGCYDTAAPDAFAPQSAPVELGVGTVGAAAAGGCLVVGSGSVHDGQRRGRFEGRVLAVPMIAGSRVVGVIELAGDHVDDLAPQQQWVLELVAGTCGTVLQAARLEHRADLRSRIDLATGLGNYRQFVSDLSVEVHRTARYGRPLALVVVGIGSATPSAIATPSASAAPTVVDGGGIGSLEDRLVVAASVATAASRACDTVYRFGPSELAVLVRESDEAGALAFARRLAERIAQVRIGTLGEVDIAAGVAALDVGAPAGRGVAVAAADRGGVTGWSTIGPDGPDVADQPVGVEPAEAPGADLLRRAAAALEAARTALPGARPDGAGGTATDGTATSTGGTAVAWWSALAGQQAVGHGASPSVGHPACSNDPQ